MFFWGYIFHVIFTGFHHCVVYFDDHVLSIVRIEAVNCEFGFNTVAPYSVVCAKDPRVTSSSIKPNEAFCNYLEFAYNADGAIYFLKENYNASTCITDPGRCAPYQGRPGRVFKYTVIIVLIKVHA